MSDIHGRNISTKPEHDCNNNILINPYNILKNKQPVSDLILTQVIVIKIVHNFRHTSSYLQTDYKIDKHNYKLRPYNMQINMRDSNYITAI